MPDTQVEGVTQEPVRVIITREPWSDYFVLQIGNSDQTEELEPDEVRAWFKERGADLTKLEPVLDEAWNFYRSVARITSFKQPALKHPAFQPQI